MEAKSGATPVLARKTNRPFWKTAKKFVYHVNLRFYGSMIYSKVFRAVDVYIITEAAWDVNKYFEEDYKMAIHTSADIDNGFYGKWVADKKNKTTSFFPLGKAVTVDEIIEHLESQQTQLKLSFEHRDLSIKRVVVDRKELGDNSIIVTLAGVGADVTKKNADIFVDSLRLQEEEIEANGQGLTRVYDRLGWINLPSYDASGNPNGSSLCYRAHKMLGGYTARYDGDYKVSPMGNFQEWKNMVESDVCGHQMLELVLLAALSAVVNGLLAPVTTGENPIFHVCFGTGKGKSTGGYLGVSTAGQPFEGEQRGLNKDGTAYKRVSLYQSWGATENATVTSVAGNRGAVVVLNELGKFKGNDMTRIVYDLSEGSDKKRLNSSMQAFQSESYYTSFISLGEVSLLEKCKKIGGLGIRVMELEKPLTDSAEHANHIKEVCRANNGHAAPMLAKHIISKGGISYALPIYNGYCKTLDVKMPNTPYKSRFIEKFAALLMTTAEIASEALGIQFDMDGLLAFLCEHEREHGQERNTAAASYDYIVEDFRVHRSCFYSNQDSFPPAVKAWGKVSYLNKAMEDGRVLTEEYAVRPEILKERLRKGGYDNMNGCLAEWAGMGVLDHEKGHYTRRRIINRESDKKERVYILQVFKMPEDCMEDLAERVKDAGFQVEGV